MEVHIGVCLCRPVERDVEDVKDMSGPTDHEFQHMCYSPAGLPYDTESWVYDMWQPTGICGPGGS